MARLEGEEAHRFAHLIEDYWASTRGLEGIMTPGPAVHRVLPSRGALNSEWILPYDDVAALLGKTRSFSVGDCVCRKQQDLLGKRKCSFPRGLCLSFSPRERPDDPHGITREEALAVLREAEEIRAYVSAVRERQAALDDPLSATGFQQWADWALSQADRLDPVLSGSFRTVQDDD